MRCFISRLSYTVVKVLLKYTLPHLRGNYESSVLPSYRWKEAEINSKFFQITYTAALPCCGAML